MGAPSARSARCHNSIQTNNLSTHSRFLPSLVPRRLIQKHTTTMKNTRFSWHKQSHGCLPWCDKNRCASTFSPCCCWWCWEDRLSDNKKPWRNVPLLGLVCSLNRYWEKIYTSTDKKCVLFSQLTIIVVTEVVSCAHRSIEPFPFFTFNQSSIQDKLEEFSIDNSNLAIIMWQKA